MPEGPEVRHACSLLDLFAIAVEDKPVIEIIEHRKDEPSKPIFEELNGQIFRGTRRKGKVWVLDFDTHSIVGHFAMWGHFVLNDRNAKHIRKEIVFSKNLKIKYCDMRNWGRMEIVAKESVNDTKMIAKLGYDVSVPFDKDEAFKILRTHPNSVIADLLLNQTVLTGLGNIWRAEAIGRANLDALRTIDSLSDEELTLLVDKIDHVMNRGGNTWWEIYRQPVRPSTHQEVLATKRKGRTLWHLNFNQ